jgi:hypothetical protein
MTMKNSLVISNWQLAISQTDQNQDQTEIKFKSKPLIAKFICQFDGFFIALHFLLRLNSCHRFAGLLLHPLCPESARFTNDAGENARDTLFIERAGILFHHASQHLAFPIAVICRQPRRNLDRGNFTGDGGTLVEQAKQLDIKRVNLASPVVECFAAIHGWLVGILIHAG